MKPLPAGPPSVPLLWRADRRGGWIWCCARWSRVTGLSQAASLGDGWLDAVHPQDREKARRPLVDGEGIGNRMLRLRLSGDQGYQSIQLSASPIHGSDGGVREWVGACQEMPADEADRQAVTIQHHMRNALASIRSVARRTALTSDTVDHYAAHFEGRLDAFARVQDAVMRNLDGGVDLEALVREELVAHRVADAGLLVIDGPRLRLVGRAAEGFVLAVHELTVNAVKFGALSTPAATVSVLWTIDRDRSPPCLLFLWSETGVAVASPAPRRRGFGTDFIERCMPYELNAVTRLDFLPGEVRCSIALPLTAETALVSGNPDAPGDDLAPSRSGRP